MCLLESYMWRDYLMWIEWMWARHSWESIVSDYYLMRVDFRLKGKWQNEHVEVNERVVIGVGELGKEEFRIAYKDRWWNEWKNRDTSNKKIDGCV